MEAFELCVNFGEHGSQSLHLLLDKPITFLLDVYICNGASIYLAATSR